MSTTSRGAGGAAAGGTRADLGHLIVLWAFAVVQPVLDVIPTDSEFFIDREVGGWSLVVMILLFAFLVPVLLFGLISRSLCRGLHLVFVWLLLALVVLYPLTIRAAGRGWQLVALAVLVAAVGTLAYSRFRLVRLLATYLIVAPVLFIVVFFVTSPAGDAVSPGHPHVFEEAPSKTPVVVVFFDEFSLTSMLVADSDRDGDIDPARFPNFARLAARSTWYRNTISSGDSTLRAVPALMTGSVPSNDLTPTFHDHPRNLFTLFARSHRLHVSESVTRLCPPEVCPPRRSQLARAMQLPSALSGAFAKIVLPRNLGFTAPTLPFTWSEFSRGGDPVSHVDPSGASQVELSHHPDVQFDDWLRTIEPQPAEAKRAPFYFAHLLTPHAPWRYLPSGKRYSGVFDDGRVVRFGGPGVWAKDRRLVLDHWLERHLIQVEFADHLLGRLIDRLKRDGLYDRAAVVVVADHGGHFAPGQSHRVVSTSSEADIGNVPFFFKRPYQRAGRVDDQFLQTIDVLPTLARQLGIRVPWKVDGRPAQTLGSRGRRHVEILKGTNGEELHLDEKTIERQRRATVRRQVRLFGTGHGTPGLLGAGPRPDLLGRRVGRTDAIRGPVRLHLDMGGDYAHVDPRSQYVPALVTGELAGNGASSVHDVAIAVNGRVATTAAIYSLGGLRLAAMLPPRALRPGHDRLSVFALSGSRGRTRLTKVGGTT
jgi:hypothetical protein